MGMLKPHRSGGFIDPRIERIERLVRYGCPTKGWPGDERMYMTIGVVIDPQTKQVVKHRAEVRRHCEDGTDQYIGSWEPHEVDLIVPDLARMRVGSPSFEDVVDRIERHNAQKEKEAMDAYKDKYGEMVEHFTSIVHDTTQPKNTFRQMGGVRDKLKAKRQLTNRRT